MKVIITKKDMKVTMVTRAIKVIKGTVAMAKNGTIRKDMDIRTENENEWMKCRRKIK